MKHEGLGRLRQLYQRRLKVTEELAQVNLMIRQLEKSRTEVAVKRVHHLKDGCRMVNRTTKTTKDWSLVDCIMCHRRRRKQPIPKTHPRSGEDWSRTVSK